MINLTDKQLDQLQEVALVNMDKMINPKTGTTLAEQNAYALQSLAASQFLLVELLKRFMEEM